MKISYKKYIIIALLVFIISISGSLAYYSWGSTTAQNTNVAFDVISDGVYIYYNGGSNIIGKDLFPTDNRARDGIVKEITVRVDEEKEGAKFNLYLDLTNLPTALKHSTFKYQIYRNGTAADTARSFADTPVTCTTNSTNHFILLSNEVPSTTTVTYTLYIWIDGTSGTNPDTMMNQEFEFNLHADGVKVKNPDIQLVNLKQYIQDTFNNATDKLTISYGNTGSVIQSASTNLLQDEAGNIRYFGASPNNYLGPVTSTTKYADIETSTGTNYGTFDTLPECTEAIQDYLDTDTCQEITVNDGWRIIGIVDNKVKVIRSSSIGNYVYDDTSNDGLNSNDYSISVLNNTLNGNDGSSGYYGNLSDKTMFDKVTWSLRGTDYTTLEAGVYANEWYNIERTTGSAYGSNATSTQAYLAPMYPSDYMYGVNFNLCKKPGYYYDSNNDTQDDYSNSECTSNNWLYSGVWEWLLSPDSELADYAFLVIGTGNVNHDRAGNVNGVRPSGYLKSDIEIDISGGNGSVSTPYLMG